MSLDRFINKEDILLAGNNGQSIIPIKWSEELNAGGALSTVNLGSHAAINYADSQRPKPPAVFYGTSDLFNGTDTYYA